MATLLISENFPPRTGGSSRWFWEIYRRLPRAEIVIAAGDDQQQEDFDRTHQLRLIRLPLTSSDWGFCSPLTLGWYWSVFQSLAAVVRSQGIDQIHCGRTLPEGWLAWMLKQRYRIPYICYAHGEEINTSYVGQPSGVLTSRQLRWMLRRVMRGADFVIANSRSTKQILTNGWGLSESKIRIMHPGVDTQRFVPAERNEAERTQLGWKDRQVVLSVGRLDPRKGHDQMILALHAIMKTSPNVLYAIIGDGEQSEFLRALVDREDLTDHVQFLGELNDDKLLSCYQQCDLFVLPNRQVGNDIEGFGIVLLEAQACGKAVVAGASGGTAETMRAPDTGRVISCDDPVRLAAEVIELLSDSDLRSQMGKAGRQWVVERFGWSALSRRAKDLFEHKLAAGEGHALIPVRNIGSASKSPSNSLGKP
jgi:phosphatidylinositol alpha-1,6-mannosyltransferase